MVSMVVSGIVTFVLGCVSAVVFFLILGLGLNGFIGQQRAVNASFGTYLVLAVLTVLMATALSVLATGLLQRRFSWHGLLAALLSSATLSVIAGVLHLACVIIAALVADGLRTNR